MDISPKVIAVVRGTSSAQVQQVFGMLAERWRSAVRLVGLIAENHGLADRACSAGYLRNVATGERFSIFADLGPGSTDCHLDGAGALTAADAVRRDIAAGCDLVLLSKFGKLESNEKGLFDAFTATIAAGIPLLPSVDGEWQKVAGRSHAVLGADLDEIDAWWRSVRRHAARHAVPVHL